MFKCDECGLYSNPNEALTHMPIKMRHVEYVDRIKGETTLGREIVKEVNLCPRCSYLVEMNIPEVRGIEKRVLIG